MARRLRLLTPGVLAFAWWGTLSLPAQLTIPWLTGDILTVLNPATIGSDDTLNIGSSADHTFNGTSLLNQGTINWQGGYLRSGSATLTNAADAVFNDSASSVIDNPYGGNFTFINHGTYNKTTAGTTALNVTFDNSALVNVQAGEFKLNGGGTQAATGIIDVGSGASLTISNSYTLASGSTLSGAGVKQATGGTLSLDGSFFVSTFKFAGAHVTGTFTLNGTYEWAAGSFSSSGVTTIAAGSELAITGSADKDFNGRSVINEGTVNWQGGYLRSGSSGFTNASEGTFNDSANSHFTNPFGGGSSFVNDGIYHKTGAGTTDFDVVFNNNAQLEVHAGEFRLNQGGTNAGPGTISAGSGATVTFANSYTLADGSTLSGAGTFQATGGTLTISGSLDAANLAFAGAALAGTHTLHGAYVWSTGGWSSSGTTTLASDAVLTISGPADKDFNGRGITNEGTVNWQGGYLRSGSSAFTNAAGGTFNDSANSHFTNPFGGSSSFINNGAYNKTGGGTTDFDVVFNNNAQLDVQAGEFRLNQGGTNSSTGSIVASTGATVTFANSYAFATGTTLSGPGTFRATGGTLSVGGDLDATNLAFAGASLAGTHTLHGAYTWSTGSWSSTGTTTISSDAVLTITGPADKDFNGRSIVNEGTVNWQGGYLRSGSSTFTNAAGGTFNDSAGAHLNNPFGGSAGFVNEGVYNKTGPGTTDLDVPFHNNAQLNVQSGALNLNAGGTNAGTAAINAASDTLVNFANSYTLANGTMLTGLGAFQATGGTLSVGGDLEAANLAFAGGSLAGTHTLHGAYTWSNGSWSSPGTTTLASDAVLTISGSSDKDFNGRNITNEGTIHWQGGYLRSGSSGFVNAGNFNDSSGAHINNPFGGSASFTNNNTYHKTGANTSTIDVPFVNNNGAVIVAQGGLRFTSSFTQSAGTLEVKSGATAQFDQGLHFAAGHLIGSGTVIGNVENYGLFAPTDFSITGNLTLQSTSGLAFKLGGTTAGSGYDRLTVSGTASLDGYLSLAFHNGFQASVTPADTFTLLNASSLGGAFDNIVSGGRLATADGFGSFEVNYSGSMLTLSNFTAVPEPSTYALMAAGLALIGFHARRRRV